MQTRAQGPTYIVEQVVAGGGPFRTRNTHDEMTVRRTLQQRGFPPEPRERKSIRLAECMYICTVHMYMYICCMYGVYTLINADQATMESGTSSPAVGQAQRQIINKARLATMDPDVSKQAHNCGDTSWIPVSEWDPRQGDVTAVFLCVNLPRTNPQMAPCLEMPSVFGI